ncbi:MFS transporter [Streptacidiphilus sp. N1-10]|uniref:MFS transporter n=1 Tax=Streptacidiphilus jeojiensis TaxID=3229225 RepID=A0ABV6XK15_9ACTN
MPKEPERSLESHAGPDDRLPEASRRRVFLIVAVTVLFAETGVLQFTMVSPAVLRIAPSFPGVGADISWVNTVFALTGAVAAPLLGKASDLWGKKRMMTVSGVLFVIGSLVTALTASWAAFLAGRVLQGLSLGIGAVAYGLFRDILPRRYVPTAIGMLTTGSGAGVIAAPLLSGYLLDHYSWRSLFWVMTLYGIATLVLLVLLVPESNHRFRQHLDLLGAFVLAAGLALLLVYLSNGHNWGWTAPGSLAYLAGGLVLLGLFVPVERRAPSPLIDLHLLGDRRVLGTLAVTFWGSVAVSVWAYAVPLMTQTPTAAQLTAGAHAQAVASGLPSATAALLHVSFSGSLAFAGGLSLIGCAVHQMVWQGGTALFAGPAAGWLAGRRSMRFPLLLGFAAFASAAVLMLALLTHGIWFFALTGAVFGLGFGAYYAITPTLMMEAAPPRLQGISAGMFSVAANIGQSIATATVTAVIWADPLVMKVTLGPKSLGQVNLTAQYSLMTLRTAQILMWIVLGATVVACTCTLVLRHARAAATGGAASEEQHAPEQAGVVAA